MSARFLIIDGYNLLHAAGMAQRDYAQGDLQRCRTRLIRFLMSKLSPAELNRATLVFDARVPPPDRPSEFRISGMCVLFANPGGDADEMIENLLASHSSPSRVTLISSDRRLQTAARRRHARPVASETFFDQMSERERPAPRGELSGKDPYDDIKQGPALTTGEVAIWQKVFGDIPGATWSATAPKTMSSDSAAQVPLPEETKSSAKSSGKSKPPATASSPSPTIRATSLPEPRKVPESQPASKSKSKKTAARREVKGRPAAIPDVTWDDLCRWLEGDRWLNEFNDDAEAERK